MDRRDFLKLAGKAAVVATVPASVLAEPEVAASAPTFDPVLWCDSSRTSYMNAMGRVLAERIDREIMNL